MAKRRGPKPRAGERATAKTDIRWTLAELAQVRELARVNNTTLADLIRLAVLNLASEDGSPTTLVLSPDLIDRIVSGHISAEAKQSNQE